MLAAASANGYTVLMPRSAAEPAPRRNRAFEETHGILIDTAVRLISEKGAEALSLAELAREAGVNRTTVYYHFSDREALVREVRAWSAAQLAKAFSIDAPPSDRADYISRFVLENPELIKLWIDDFLAPGDIRERYPEWDNLVSGVAARFARERPGDQIDAELYCVNMLTVAMIAPRVYANSVRPELGLEEAMERFNREQMRMLGHDGLDELPG
jgi:AcrR family transcriptional regulator